MWDTRGIGDARHGEPSGTDHETRHGSSHIDDYDSCRQQLLGDGGWESPPQLSSDLRRPVATLVQESISTRAEEHLLFVHDLA